MARIKLTKGELKRQREALKRFQRFLPILHFKKNQLQLEIQHITEKIDLKMKEILEHEKKMSVWSGFLKEPGDYVSIWIKPKKVMTKNLNIVGVVVPDFAEVIFEEADYDFFQTPLWVDVAIPKLCELVILWEQKKIYIYQSSILREALRTTTQRVNLFEKVKIPECEETIRKIKIYLGDQEVNAVGRSKIVKKKAESMVLEGISL